MFTPERDNVPDLPCCLALGYVSGSIGFAITGDTKLRRLNVPARPTAQQLALAVQKRELPHNNVALVGTQPDGRPGIEGIDHKNLGQLLRMPCSVVSDVAALHTYLLASEDPPASRTGYAVITAGKTSDSVRWYGVLGNSVQPKEVIYCGAAGEVHVVKGAKQPLNRNRPVIVDLVVALSRSIPKAGNLYVWSPDKMLPLAAATKTYLIGALPPHTGFKILTNPALALFGGRLLSQT